MSQPHDKDDARRTRLDRRGMLRGLAGAATLAAAGAAAARAHADDMPLDALIGDTDHSGFGQDFDQASRTIHMPKASAPTLSPATSQFTETAIGTYDGIVAHGGWPVVPKAGELRLGGRDPSVADLRQRLSVSGDLDPSSVGNDIYDSYVECCASRRSTP
jgi:L,D-transpeptidase YcbB